ncbi:MAG: metal ABC transporter substrate-binding protein [Clostridia bacterium]|nr:metal ABC transporter substrate-binding protein [Clostridia bacterium]
MLKKIICTVICFLMLTFSFAGCSDKSVNYSDGKLKIVTTVFPVYDWVRNIAGDNGNCDITMLLDMGVDLHSFQPTADDLVRISTCDVFFYVGGESDDWVDDALKDLQNKDAVTVNLMDALGDAVKEEAKGVEESEDDGQDAHEAEYDEHIWLSLKNASKLTDVICSALCKADGDNADEYKINAEKYKSEIDKLDGEYSLALKECKNNTLVFGDRFPFIYLLNDYGIDYFAAFSGCSTETNASFETVITLAEKINELSLNYIMVLEGSDSSTAEKIAESCKRDGVEILSLNSLQYVTKADVENGCTYIDIMKDNLKVIEKALG